ncbi:MAG TPA: acyltransferase [Euzebya sp.]|nr:acyltransferase [Euzebya sp.]
MGTAQADRRYWPALDGMRGVAVLLVIAYHGERSLAPRGGAIGVTMFFTLSGFLITTLLLRERADTGRIGLGRFYWRRALRLLPALVTLVAVTCAYALVTGNQERTLGAALPVLLYVGNWMRTLRDSEGLGLLEHTWSLSIEEQFYLVWPLAVMAAAALVPRARQAEAVLVLSVGGSLASLLWRLQLWDPEEPRWSAARLYNGTDAVVDQLLVGAALAAGLAIWDRRRAARASGSRPVPEDGASESRPVPKVVGAVLAPLALAYLVFVARVRPGGDSLDNDRRYLEWGSLTFALAGAVVVLACVRSADQWLPRLLSVPPLIAIGKVSYGLYLWHFPVILVVDEQLPDAPDLVRGGAVIAATAGTTLLSWFLVERPFLKLKDGPRTSVPAPPRPPVVSTRP